jgi:hypothetical protein
MASEYHLSGTLSFVDKGENASHVKQGLARLRGSWITVSSLSAFGYQYN